MYAFPDMGFHEGVFQHIRGLRFLNQLILIRVRYDDSFRVLPQCGPGQSICARGCSFPQSLIGKCVLHELFVGRYLAVCCEERLKMVYTSNAKNTSRSRKTAVRHIPIVQFECHRCASAVTNKNVAVLDLIMLFQV